MSGYQYPLFPEELQNKVCAHCKVKKPLSGYHVSRATKDGLVYICKECAIEEAGKWAAENVERANETKRRWAAENPEKAREASRKYYRNNIESRLEYFRELYKNNREVMLARGKLWRQANPDIVRAQGERRRAREANVFSGPKPTIEELLAMQNGKCAYCRTTSPEQWHMDHVIPISKGGPDTADNVVAACASCNTSKQNQDVDKWMRIKGYLN